MITSCTKSADPISLEVAQTAKSQAAVNAQTSEVDDVVTNQLNVTDLAPGRTDSGIEDERVKCAVITRNTTPNTDKKYGTIVINFGTGCTDAKGNVRKGKIIVNWTTERWYLPGASYRVTFDGYSINGVKFSNDDFRSVRNVSTATSPLTFNIEASHKMTWPDNTTETHTVHHTRQWVRSATVMDDKMIISQMVTSPTASTGKNRHDKSYSIVITVPLEYSRSCAISNKVYKPVKGVMIITYDNTKKITVDFGKGACDNTYTITAEGKTETIVAKNDDSDD
jgi:hypothetical protein